MFQLNFSTHYWKAFFFFFLFFTFKLHFKPRKCKIRFTFLNKACCILKDSFQGISQESKVELNPHMFMFSPPFREHNTASSQENSTPSLPPLSSSSQSFCHSPAVQPASKNVHSLQLNNGTSATGGLATPTSHGGYLTPSHAGCQQVSSLSPLSSPLTVTPTSFMSPRPPRGSPSVGSPHVPGGHPFSPSCGPGGLHSPAGVLSHQQIGGEGTSTTISFSLSSPLPPRQTLTPSSSHMCIPLGRSTEETQIRDGGPKVALQCNLKLDQLLEGTVVVSSSQSAYQEPSQFPPQSSQCPASHSTLTERHKILHSLLQDNSPVDQADANRKEPDIKKEPPASPSLASLSTCGSREPQDHQLLRFLLDTDEKDLGDLPPPAAFSLQTVRVKAEKKGNGEMGSACAATTAIHSPKESEKANSSVWCIIHI